MILMSYKRRSLGETFEQDMKNEETVAQRLTAGERSAAALGTHASGGRAAGPIGQEVQV